MRDRARDWSEQGTASSLGKTLICKQKRDQGNGTPWKETMPDVSSVNLSQLVAQQPCVASVSGKLTRITAIFQIAGMGSTSCNIRAVYTGENKPRITQSAAYVSRELLV